MPRFRLKSPFCSGASFSFLMQFHPKNGPSFSTLSFRAKFFRRRPATSSRQAFVQHPATSTQSSSHSHFFCPPIAADFFICLSFFRADFPSSPFWRSAKAGFFAFFLRRSRRQRFKGETFLNASAH